MSTGPEGEQRLADMVRGEAKAYLLWIISSLLDACFVIFWVLLQWGTKWVLGLVALDGLDAVTLRVFQVIFALTTLAPILAHVTKNIVIIGARAIVFIVNQWYSAKREIEKTKRDK